MLPFVGVHARDTRKRLDTDTVSLTSVDANGSISLFNEERQSAERALCAIITTEKRVINCSSCNEIASAQIGSSSYVSKAGYGLQPIALMPYNR